MFEFLKNYSGLGNGDLILLLAFRKGWKLKIRDCVENLGLRDAHAWRILETFRAKGICKKTRIKVVIPGIKKRRDYVNTYIFNNKAFKMVERIFEKKILPKVPITREDFLNKDEVHLIVE